MRKSKITPYNKYTTPLRIYIIQMFIGDKYTEEKRRIGISQEKYLNR